jgi:hypothetical protein
MINILGHSPGDLGAKHKLVGKDLEVVRQNGHPRRGWKIHHSWGLGVVKYYSRQLEEGWYVLSSYSQFQIAFEAVRESNAIKWGVILISTNKAGRF